LAIGHPAPLGDEHTLGDFQCSSPALTHWLIHRARKNHGEGASKCFVACDDDQNVIGYYALAAGSMSHDIAPGSIKRNMPDPVPVVVLGRLAVDIRWINQGVGQGLLKDAIQRALQVGEQMGIRAMLCHAIDANAKAFYLKHGFIESPVDPMTVMLSLVRLKDALSGKIPG
jgi:predicted N-acetyltransferase YhbS